MDTDPARGDEQRSGHEEGRLSRGGGFMLRDTYLQEDSSRVKRSLVYRILIESGTRLLKMDEISNLREMDYPRGRIEFCVNS